MVSLRPGWLSEPQAWLAGPQAWLAWTQALLAWPQAWLAGSQAWLVGPQAWLAGPQAWPEGLEGGGRTNGWTQGKSPHSTGLRPLSVPLHKNRGKATNRIPSPTDRGRRDSTSAATSSSSGGKGTRNQIGRCHITPTAKG